MCLTCVFAGLFAGTASEHNQLPRLLVVLCWYKLHQHIPPLVWTDVDGGKGLGSCAEHTSFGVHRSLGAAHMVGVLPYEPSLARALVAHERAVRRGPDPV
jgi:hypothetical protein